MKKLMIVLCLVPVIGLALVVYDPLDVAQNTLAVSNSADALVKQTEQLRRQARQIQYQTKNSKKLSSYQYQAIARILKQSDNLAKQGEALSYSSQGLDKKFRKKYPAYGTSWMTDNYQQRYKTWNRSTLTTLENSLRAIGLSTNTINQDDKVLKRLERQGSSANGRMQVLQVTSQLAAMNVAQLQKLQHIIGAQANAQTAYMSSQTSRQARQDVSMATLVHNMNVQAKQMKPHKHISMFISTKGWS